MGRFLSAVGDYLYAALVALVVAGVLLWAIGLTIARGQTTPLDGTMTFTGDTHYTPPTLSLGDFHAEKLSRDEVKALFAARQAVLQAQEKLDAVEDATKRAQAQAMVAQGRAVLALLTTFATGVQAAVGAPRVGAVMPSYVR